MTKTKDLMTLAQWLSPAFPLGGFAYSHGLETLITTQQVTNAQTLEDWLRSLLHHGSGQSDAIFFARGYSAETEADLLQIDAIARAFATTPERRREAVLQGAAFADTCNAIWHLDLPPLTLPVALGRAAALKSLPAEPALALYLQSFVSNLVSAAVRLVPLGQTDGQKTLANLQADILQITPTVGPLYSNAFAWDIAAMHHETLQPKLFRS